MGVARGWIDPTKERAGAVMGMDPELSTLMRACAKQGFDYEEMLRQRATKIRLLKELGLELPNWRGRLRSRRWRVRKRHCCRNSHRRLTRS